MHGRILTVDGVPVGEDDLVWVIGACQMSHFDQETAIEGKIRAFNNAKIEVFVQGDGSYSVYYEHMFKNRKNLALAQRKIIQESIDKSVAETKRLRKVLAGIEKSTK